MAELAPVFFVIGLTGFFLILFVWALRRGAVLRRCQPGRYYCKDCHYDVTESLHDRCTECGAHVLPSGLEMIDRPISLPVFLLYMSAHLTVYQLVSLMLMIEELGVTNGMDGQAGPSGVAGQMVAIVVLSVAYLGPSLFALTLADCLEGGTLSQKRGVWAAGFSRRIQLNRAAAGMESFVGDDAMHGRVGGRHWAIDSEHIRTTEQVRIDPG